MSPGAIPALLTGLRPIVFSILLLPSALALKREKIGIISAILGVVAEGRIGKTHLMYRSNLDSRSLKKYVALMIEEGLLTSEKDSSDHETYHLTEKGRDFLQRYNNLEVLLVNKARCDVGTLEVPELKNVNGSTHVNQTSGLGQTLGRPPFRESGLPKNRVAVLPMVNMTNDSNDEYFADGMTDEMISTLSNISGITVISRTSVMQYKGAKKSLIDIGRELGAGTLLEGSVRKTGNRVRISVQLIDALEDNHLWAKSYDRELRDIFAVQSDVATNVADALKVRLLESEAVQIKKKHAENIEAYALYLRGRSLWNRRDRKGVLGSLKLFQEAIKLDPDYAKAYSGLADAYDVAAAWGFMDRADGHAKSREAAAKALELDDTLAEAHASLGVNLHRDWRWEEAPRELRRAIELNPNYATAHEWYSKCLLETGRMKEAMEEIEKARALDPLSPTITVQVGAMNVEDGRLDEAIEVFDKLIESEPNYANAYEWRAYCYRLKGMKERAYTDEKAWYKLRRDEDGYKYKRAETYGWFGERGKALAMTKELIPKAGRSSVCEADIARLYAVLGDTDEFFKWMDRAISAKRIEGVGGITVTRLRSWSLFDKVREDPRFPEIFKKLGLPY